MKSLLKFEYPTPEGELSTYFVNTITSEGAIAFMLVVAAIVVIQVARRDYLPAISIATIAVIITPSVALTIADSKFREDYKHLVYRAEDKFFIELYDTYSKEELIMYRKSPEVGEKEKSLATRLLNGEYAGWSMEKGEVTSEHKF